MIKKNLIVSSLNSFSTPRGGPEVYSTSFKFLVGYFWGASRKSLQTEKHDFEQKLYDLQESPNPEKFCFYLEVGHKNMISSQEKQQ